MLNRTNVEYELLAQVIGARAAQRGPEAAVTLIHPAHPGFQVIVYPDPSKPGRWLYSSVIPVWGISSTGALSRLEGIRWAVSGGFEERVLHLCPPITINQREHAMMTTLPTVLLVASASDFLAAEVAWMPGAFQVERARPGDPALRRFIDLRPGCVVLDAAIPGLREGYVLAALRRALEGIPLPLYVFSVLPEAVTHQVVLALGEKRCIAFSLSPEELTQVMQPLMNIVERAMPGEDGRCLTWR